MKNVSIIDYDMCNLFSVQKACKVAGLNPTITSNPEDINNSDAIILPGVGAFGEAMQNLDRLSLINPIKHFINSGKPFLGICLGFHLLFEQSEEFGIKKGLGILRGHVEKLPDEIDEQRFKIPSIGWYTVEKQQGHDALLNFLNQKYMYFVHSFYVNPFEPENISLITNYDDFSFCSGIQKDNVIGVQFHPEKSGEDGLELYRRWASLIN